jgi:peroxiredoxin
MQQIQRRILYLMILISAFVWILVSADKSGASTSGKIHAPQKGFLAPEFELKTPKGETVKLSNLRGQAVLVNLWATWCPPCRAEMETIEKIYQEYQDKEFAVLAVNMTYQDEPLGVMPFVNEHRLTFPILLDETGEMAKAYQGFVYGRRQNFICGQCSMLWPHYSRHWRLDWLFRILRQGQPLEAPQLCPGPSHFGMQVVIRPRFMNSSHRFLSLD